MKILVPGRQAEQAAGRERAAAVGCLPAAWKRGSGMERDALPDLQKKHRKLARTGDSLVVVETGRITNRLNTLGEDVFRWAVRWAVFTRPRGCDSFVARTA